MSLFVGMAGAVAVDSTCRLTRDRVDIVASARTPAALATVSVSLLPSAAQGRE